MTQIISNAIKNQTTASIKNKAVDLVPFFSSWSSSIRITRLLVLLCSLCFCNQLSAQVSKTMHSSEILQALKKLNTTGSVLYIAAHPDDENTRLLAYLANEKKLRTAYLSITRGDGGQNLIGKEQGEALGLVRTQELLAARRKDGAEQFFTRANDFGYSKNPEETFSFWNRDSVLYDVVLTIRRFKPGVIICRFPTTGEGGHGHHTASAILAEEAFSAAADPNKFPDQLKYVEVWKTKSLYWNTFNFGGTNTTNPNQLKIDVGVYNALLGKSYGEIAAESRSMHKSQGFGSTGQRGSTLEYFKFLKGDSAKADLFESVNTSWKGLKGAEKLDKLITSCIQGFNMEFPEKSIPQLVTIYKEIKVLKAEDKNLMYWKQLKLEETEKLILACSGLWLEALSADYTAIPGESTAFSAQLVNRSNTNIILRKISYSGFSDTAMALNLKLNELYSFKRKERLPATTPLSAPYWLNKPHSEGMYTVNERDLIGKPENDSPLKIKFSLTVNDLDLDIERAVIYKYADPAKGEIHRPVEIICPVTIQLPEKAFVFAEKTAKTIIVTLKANAANQTGKLSLYTTDGFLVKLNNPVFSLKNKGDEATFEATVTPDKDVNSGQLMAEITLNGNHYNKSVRRIEYDHIPYQFILSEATSKLICLDLKKVNTNIAYVPGAGDDVENCLKQVGFNVTRLSDEMLSKEDLSGYDAIVTGVRAYNTNERLPALNSRLMDYVKNGGNLIVQYNTNSRVGPLQLNIGPYPFTISRDRVTNERAEVRFINNKHAALTYPNQINNSDFDGWIQERGIYFATEFDKQYETILSMNDKGEKNMDGSLIIGKYGKGNFVYTGLVFFRELPAGVPGAYRLFTNLLSLPKNN